MRSQEPANPMTLHIIELSEEIFKEKLAPGCRHRQQVAGGWGCEITGGSCEKPWKCPRLRGPGGCEAEEKSEGERNGRFEKGREVRKGKPVGYIEDTDSTTSPRVNLEDIRRGENDVGR